jgi:hypothetical protein
LLIPLRFELEAGAFVGWALNITVSSRQRVLANFQLTGKEIAQSTAPASALGGDFNAKLIGRLQSSRHVKLMPA